MSDAKVILVTGASRGIGRALASELSARGHQVFGTGRSWPDDKAGLSFTAIDMDVKDDASVKTTIEKIIQDNGLIDILVNNAGVSHSGSIEETPLDIARDMFETNYVGVVRVIQAALPKMREQESGTIAIVGSAAGKIGIPFQAHYAASKFAVEGLAEALRHELKQFNIRVLLIEPGDVKTEIWERSRRPAADDSPYTRAIRRFYKIKDKEMGDAADSAEDVSKHMADIILSNTKKLRHPVAKGAAFFMLARKLLPDSIFLWAVGRNYAIKQ